jgi:hypothetical protein
MLLASYAYRYLFFLRQWFINVHRMNQRALWWCRKWLHETRALHEWNTYIFAILVRRNVKPHTMIVGIHTVCLKISNQMTSSILEFVENDFILNHAASHFCGCDTSAPCSTTLCEGAHHDYPFVIQKE